MKSIFLIFILLTSNVFASEEVTYSKVKKVQEELADMIDLDKGVNGIGITYCDVNTGKRFDISLPKEEQDLEFCVSFYTINIEGYNYVRAHFPLLERVSGVLVDVEIVGEISIQPALSASSN